MFLTLKTNFYIIFSFESFQIIFFKSQKFWFSYWKAFFISTFWFFQIICIKYKIYVYSFK